MAKIILGFVGQIASGKDVSKKYLEKKYGAESCRFSSVLRDILTRVGIEIKRENLQKLSTILRQAYGEDLFAKAIAKDASNLSSDIVIIDGVRRLTDIVYLEKLPNFFLIKIDADPKLRYERMKLRNDNVGDDKKTFGEFVNDQNAEADKEVPLVMSKAIFTIKNDGSFEDLYRELDQLIENLKNNI